MTDHHKSPDTTADVLRDDWQSLRSLTNARIALGRAGGSLPTQAWLEFRLAHARARDAVWKELDTTALANAIRQDGFPCMVVESGATDMQTFLRRPDLGRCLNGASTLALENASDTVVSASPGIAVIISGGLSPLAVENHARTTLLAFKSDCTARGLPITQVVVTRFGRVAIGDPIGRALGSAATVVLIGERPGLDSPDSLGAYLTFDPVPGRTDGERNCVSNIHDTGLSPEAAAHRLAWLTEEALRRRLSGVALKDESPALVRV